jgi:hypothetical protein
VVQGALESTGIHVVKAWLRRLYGGRRLRGRKNPRPEPRVSRETPGTDLTQLEDETKSG